MNFVNPDLLGSMSTFRRIFGDPITQSRDRGATPEEVALGQQRSAELQRRVDAFMLRRTKEINVAYLPPLHSYVAFCRPTPLQVCGAWTHPFGVQLSQGCHAYAFEIAN